jgi:hypothetical protein
MCLFSTLILALVSLVGTGLLLIGPTLTPAHAAPPTDVHFVNQANVPIAGTIRVLCYDGPTAGSPIADILITTDAAGYPTTSLPVDCEYLAALRQVHAQPSGKPHHGPAYWVYATSWEPGASTPLAANGAIVIYSNRPLVLFNVAV